MPAPTPVSLIARGVSLTRADRTVLRDVDLVVTERSRLAVVGPNGIGKSTLLAVLAGELDPDASSVRRTPPTARVGLVRQQLDRTMGPTVRDLLAQRTGVAAAQATFDDATATLAADEAGAADRYDDALAAWLASGAADLDARIGEVADELGLDPVVLDRSPADLSGGAAGRVGLSAVLLSRFDVVLLDEPTNDLDQDGLARLERWLADTPAGVVLVAHDRRFLERTVGAVLELDEHDHTATVFEGGWEAFVTERATARHHAEERHGAYVAERDRLAARARRQREWATKGLGRAKKRPSDGDKIRRAMNIAQTEKLAGKAKATERAIERLEAVDKPWEGWELRFAIAAAERSGSVVGRLEGAIVRRGDFALGPVDLDLAWAERVALAGPNGSGKTTLIGALLGRVPLAAGSAHLGPGVVVGELDQRRHGLDRPDVDVARAFQDASGLTTAEVRSVLAKFGLDAEAIGRPAASLSPGERTRAQLALFQARGVNLLVLDEPTNHLDLPAIEQLEQALASYTGTLVLVSHDRRFCEAVAVDRTVDLGAGDLGAG